MHIPIDHCLAVVLSLAGLDNPLPGQHAIALMPELRALLFALAVHGRARKAP